MAGFVRAQLGAGSPIEDVCQQIMVKMVLGLPRQRQVDAFEGWLFQIARNACRDHRRRERWRQRLFVALRLTHAEVPALEPRDTAGEQRLLGALATLERDDREVLTMWLRGPPSYAELARLTESSVPAVKSRLFRARQRLRGLMERDQP